MFLIVIAATSSLVRPSDLSAFDVYERLNAFAVVTVVDAVDPDPWQVLLRVRDPFSRAPVYQAVRLFEGRTQSVDSEACPFGQTVNEIQSLTPRTLKVPYLPDPDGRWGGVRPVHPRVQYRLVARGNQASGSAASVSLSASDGALADWAERARIIFDNCPWEDDPIILTEAP